VAWHDKEQRIRAERVPNRTGSAVLTDPLRELSIGNRLSERNRHGGIPDLLFKIRAEHRETEPMEAPLLPIEVRPKLLCASTQIITRCGGVLQLLLGETNAAHASI